MQTRYVAGAARPPRGGYDADIVILSLNRPAETQEAIASALAQRGLSRHVTVLDQGSSAEALQRIAAFVSDRDDATLLVAQENLGVPGGRNAASDFGHGRVIIGLDNDAEFAWADTAARAVRTMDEAPELAALGFRILRHGTPHDDASSWGYPPAMLARANASFNTVTFVGAGHAIRRAAWEQIGGYDPSLFFCWEEYEFCLRALAAGWSVRYDGRIAVTHKVSAEQRVCWSCDRWFYFVRNRLRIERRWGASWFGLGPRMAGYVIRGALNRQGVNTLLAIAAARQADANGRRFRKTRAMREYMLANDGAWRRGLIRRLRGDVLRGFATGAAPEGGTG